MKAQQEMIFRSDYHYVPPTLTSLENGLLALYRLRPLRPSIIRRARALDGGSLELSLLRRIFRKHHNITVGEYSYGGCFNATHLAAGTSIGKFCSSANQISNFAANQKLHAVTTHPFVYNPAAGVGDEDLRELNNLPSGMTSGWAEIQ
jgi:hypothetical protein